VRVLFLLTPTEVLAGCAMLQVANELANIHPAEGSAPAQFPRMLVAGASTAALAGPCAASRKLPMRQWF